MTLRIVVIGAGAAGVEAAVAAAQAGAAVTLVSDGPVGGRGGWDSLLPSKVWLHAAGLHGAATDPAAVRAQISAATAVWSARELTRLREADVTLLSGVAAFSSAGTVTVTAADGARQPLTADRMIVAAGSVPRFPADLKPDGSRLIAPRHLGSLQQVPPTIAVIGGGATGAEAASLFHMLGSRVTWYSGPQGALPALPDAAGQRLEQAFARDGVQIVHQTVLRALPAEDEVTIEPADGSARSFAQAFLAVGRRPDLDRLNLAAAGLSTPLTVDGFGRSAQPHIYAVGDAAGGTMLANRAQAQGWIAGRHAAGAAVAPYRADLVVQAVYATPELAFVGSADVGPAGQQIRVDSRSVMKQTVDGAPPLELDLFVAADGHLRGALALGPHAAELLSGVAVALAGGVTITQLAQVFPAAPTYGELLGVAARVALTTSAAPEVSHD